MKKIFITLLLFILNFFLISVSTAYEEEKLKIGVLVPLTGDDAKLGKQILKSVRMALKDINNNQIQIHPKDTQSDPNITLRSAIELQELGINLAIGPVFYKNLIHLNDVNDITFLSLTNIALWLTNCLASALVEANPILYTILSNLLSNICNKLSPVTPFFLAACL